MYFSLIISTLGRTSEVERLLASLAAQTFRDFEVLIVDQNEDDRLHLVLESFKNRLPLTVWRQGRRGLSAGRNVGIRNAAGEFCAFPDDDCTYPPELLAETHARISAGRFDGLALRVTDEHGNGSIGGDMSEKSMLLTKENVWECVITPGLFVSRRALLEVGGFDENLGLGAAGGYHSSEDTALVLAMLARGGRILYAPELRVIHPAPVWTGDSGRARRHGLGMGRVLADAEFSQPRAWRHAFRQFLEAAQRLVCGSPQRAKWHLNVGLGRLQGYYRHRKNCNKHSDS